MQRISFTTKKKLNFSAARVKIESSSFCDSFRQSI